MKERNLPPKEVQADSLYGSDDNCETAKSMGVEVISPTMGTTKSDGMTLSDFDISDDGQVEKCPQGHLPVYFNEGQDNITQGFPVDICSNCPMVEECSIKEGKKYYYLRYIKKSARLAKRRRIENTDEFKDRYRWRAGVEATMSEYDRRTGAKRLRSRGFDSVRYAATLKAVAVNIFRVTAARNAAIYA